MGLQHHRIDRLASGDGDQTGSWRSQQVEGGAKDVEGAVQVYIDHSAKGVGRHAEHRRKKVSRRAGNNNVERAKLVMGGLQGAANGGVVTHVGRKTQRVGSYALRGFFRLFRIAADDADLGPQLRVSLGNAQIDAAGSSGDKGRLAHEQIVAKGARHWFPPCLSRRSDAC